MGFLHYASEPMRIEEAQRLLESQDYFDYLNGRVMKISLKGDELDPWGYDRDNGSGEALRVITELRATGDTFSETSELHHLEQTRKAAKLAQDAINLPSGPVQSDGIVTFCLGLSDMADVLGPIVDDILKDSDD
jgi:hypothetical protein